MTLDVLVVSPFRRATFRKAISNRYPGQEPWDSPPLTVAGGLESAGLQVGYLALQNLFDAWDERRDLPRLREMLHAQPARVVLFASDYFIPSRSTATVFGMQIVAREARSADADVIIGSVGRLPTTAGRSVFSEVPECDFLVHGEPESVIGDIVTQLLRGGVGSGDHPSLVTRTSMERGDRPEPASTDTLDETPLPAWHLLTPSVEWWDKYQNRGGADRLPFSLRTSAGCRFRCRFCAGVPNWLKYRTKSAERVAIEVDTLLDALQGRAYVSFLEDEIFTRDLDHVVAISDVFVQRELKVEGVYTHSSMLTPEIASQVSRMARRVYLGLDNADDEILRDMRKGQRFDTVMSAVGIARAAGLGTHLEWIVGSPPETIDSITTSLNAIVSLLATGVVDSVGTYVYCPHPGTEYAEKAEVFGVEMIGGLEDIQESGGYPASETSRLSAQQVFTAYLMSQLAISEILQSRAQSGPDRAVGTPSRDELRRILERLGR
ncbi:B12-binding domain-containing radical SAM protein [Streptomyces sp. NPDC001107]